ncbi:Pre-rRNA-processing protein ESF2-like protein [Drosera capensis]
MKIESDEELMIGDEIEPQNENNNDEEEEREKIRKEKMRRKLMKEAKKARMRGVCYLSRVPPKMDPPKLRQILSQYADIDRIYLAPEDPAATVKRKKSGGFRGQEFSEG